MAKGAGAANVGMLISSVTTLKLEDIVKGGNATNLPGVHSAFPLMHEGY